MATFALSCVLALPIQAKLTPHAEATTDDTTKSLKLLISVEQQTITAPHPARVALHLHNAGQHPIWLYRRARNQGARARSEFLEITGGETSGGSTLAVRLEPAGATALQTTTPAEGRVLATAGLPRPRLVRLGPGDDYEEKTTLRLTPALAETDKPIWGRYRLSVVYQASYSNEEEIHRNLGVTLWQGEATSNTIEIELAPPAVESRASVAGTVIRPDSAPVAGAVVSLSDQEERVVDQARTDADGRFSFSHLPWGLYWVMARRENASEDTTVFRHVEVTEAAPAGALQLVLLPPEIYEPQKLLHKPVVFRITDSAGHPLDKARLEITWSNGPVVDNVKGETGEDGTVALELIPGRNFVTLRRRGCPKQEHRVDVAAGDGIDGFNLALECAK